MTRRADRALSILMRSGALLLALAALSACALAEAGMASVPLAGLSPEALHNAGLAARAVDGSWIPSGSDFSFENALGARTREAGWLEDGGAGAALAEAALRQALEGMGGAVILGEGDGLAFANPGAPLTLSMWIEGDWLRCVLTPDAGPAPEDAPAEGAMSAPAQLLAATAALPWSGDAAALENALLAADSVYDITLRSGDIFSFNEVVGPRTADYGFREAEDATGARVVGGGVERLAEVIRLALRNLPGATLLECEALAGGAVRVDGGADFSFRYDGPGSVTLFTYAAEGALCCDISRQ